MKAKHEAEYAKLDERMKLWLLVVSLLTIVILAAAAARENIFADWRHYRRAYASILREQATDDLGKQAYKQFEQQIVLLPKKSNRITWFECPKIYHLGRRKKISYS